MFLLIFVWLTLWWVWISVKIIHFHTTSYKWGKIHTSTEGISRKSWKNFRNSQTLFYKIEVHDNLRKPKYFFNLLLHSTLIFVVSSLHSWVFFWLLGCAQHSIVDFCCLAYTTKALSTSSKVSVRSGGDLLQCCKSQTRQDQYRTPNPLHSATSAFLFL